MLPLTRSLAMCLLVHVFEREAMHCACALEVPSRSEELQSAEGRVAIL